MLIDYNCIALLLGAPSVK